MASQRKAIEKAIATNTPLVVWRDNKVVEIPPEELKKKLKRFDKNKPKKDDLLRKFINCLFFC